MYTHKYNSRLGGKGVIPLRSQYYGVFFDIRNYAYVCSAPDKEDLDGAYRILENETEAKRLANVLNKKRMAEAAMA